jgi:glycosyltransferase involved in cell wall biosynthesis
MGPSPAWLELEEVGAELEGIALERVSPRQPVTRAPQVVHVTRAALGELDNITKQVPDSVFVLDLTAEGDTALTQFQAQQASLADLVLAGSGWELEELLRRLPLRPKRTGVVTRPLDLDWHAPEAQLAETKGRGRDLRRFRRFHRLAAPAILFVGPYTEAGGLDLLLEAVFRLRERMPELRLAAIPHGPTDERYRDRCEQRALGLGHHGIVEWTPDESEIPFWYAIAAVVCAPAREAGSPEPAKRAAAGGRPFVGSDLEPFREHVDEGTTGFLVPAGDVGRLQGALGRLLDAEDESTRLGEAARRKAETDYSPAAAARALRQEWENLLDGVGSASHGGRAA